MACNNMVRGLDRTPTISALEKMLEERGGAVHINPDGSVSAAEELKGIARKVAELEDKADELNEIRATLLVNFGEGSKHNEYGIMVRDEGRTSQMLMRVLEELVKRPGG